MAPKSASRPSQCAVAVAARGRASSCRAGARARRARRDRSRLECLSAQILVVVASTPSGEEWKQKHAAVCGGGLELGAGFHTKQPLNVGQPTVSQVVSSRSSQSRLDPPPAPPPVTQGHDDDGTGGIRSDRTQTPTRVVRATAPSTSSPSKRRKGEPGPRPAMGDTGAPPEQQPRAECRNPGPVRSVGQVGPKAPPTTTTSRRSRVGPTNRSTNPQCVRRCPAVSEAPGPGAPGGTGKQASVCNILL